MNRDPFSLSSLQDFSLADLPPGFLACIVTAALAIYVALWAVVCALLQGNLRHLPARHRLITPGQLWLLLIPAFNIWWLWVVVRRLSGSWRQVFAQAGQPGAGGGYGLGPGLWWAGANAFCNVAQFFPYPAVQALVFLVSLAFFIFMVVYLILLSDLRHQAAALGESPVA